MQTPSSHFASPAILNFLGPAISPIPDGGPTPVSANVQQPPPSVSNSFAVPLSVAHTPMSVQSSIAPSVSASATGVHTIAGVGTGTTHSNSPPPSDSLDEEFPALPSTSFIQGSALSSTATSEVAPPPSGSATTAPPAPIKPLLPPVPVLVPKKPPHPPQLSGKKEKERPKPALPAIVTNLKGKAKATPVASTSTTPIKEIETEGKEKAKEKEEASKEKEKAKEAKKSSSKVTSTKSEAAATSKAGAKAASKVTPIPTQASGPVTKQKEVSSPVPPSVEEHAPIMARQTKKVKASQMPKPRKQQPHAQNMRDDTTRESTPELSSFIQETAQPVVPHPPIAISKAGVDELLAQMYDLPELKWMSFFGGGPGLHPRSKLELSSLVEALSALSGTAHAWSMSNGHYKDGGSTNNSHSTTPIDNAVISFQQLLETLTHTISDLLHLLPRTTWNEGVNFDGIIQDMLKSDLLDEFGPRDEDEDEEGEDEVGAEEQGEGDEVSNAENFAEGIDRRAQWMQLQCESSIPADCGRSLMVPRPASEQARRTASRHQCGFYSSRACLQRPRLGCSRVLASPREYSSYVRQEGRAGEKERKRRNGGQT